MNAIAHAMEAFYAPDRNPVIVLMCKDAMAAFRDGDTAADRGSAGSRGARAGALCGLVLLDGARPLSRWRCTTSSRMSSAARSTRRMPKPTRSFCPIRPPSTKRRCPSCLRPIAEAFGGGSAGGGIWDFAQAVGSPLSLKDIGIKESRSRPRCGDRRRRTPMQIRGRSTWDRSGNSSRRRGRDAVRRAEIIATRGRRNP